jgi:hypothetical protein
MIFLFCSFQFRQEIHFANHYLVFSNSKHSIFSILYFLLRFPTLPLFFRPKQARISHKPSKTKSPQITHPELPTSQNQLLEIASTATTQSPDTKTIEILKANKIWHSTDFDKLESRRKWRRYKKQQRKQLQKRKTEVCRHLPSVVNKTSQLRAFQDDSKHNINCCC